jgi:hypothetical protein
MFWTAYEYLLKKAARRKVSSVLPNRTGNSFLSAKSTQALSLLFGHNVSPQHLNIYFDIFIQTLIYLTINLSSSINTTTLCGFWLS